MLRVIILLLLAMGLNGCFIAPGMRMQTPHQTPQSYAAATEIQPNFIPIDVELIQRIKQENNLRYHNYAYHYQVGAQDVLSIYVWGHPEFNSPAGQVAAEAGGNSMLNPTLAHSGFLVNADGKIFYPIVGYVTVMGNTVEEVRRKIATALRRYVRNPQVDVRVTGFRSKKIYVMGEVYKPGLQPLTDSPMSITDAINLAGGMDPNFADPSHIFIIRGNGNYWRPDVYWLNAKSPAALVLAESFYLQPQDVVFVSTAGVANWNRAISQILPTVQTAWMTYSMLTQFNNR